MRAGCAWAAGLALILGLACGGREARAEYRHKGKRDPMVPLVLPDGRRINPPGLEEPETGTTQSDRTVSALQGIVYDPVGESYAILDGRVVRKGEEYNGMRVLKIEPTTVTVWEDGNTRVLSVGPEPKEKTNE